MIRFYPVTHESMQELRGRYAAAKPPPGQADAVPGV
jgi:hypothetical protein